MPEVQPKPGGGQSLPRLLLVKPDRTGDELLDGLVCNRQLAWPEVPKCADLRPVLALKPVSAPRRRPSSSLCAAAEATAQILVG